MTSPNKIYSVQGLRTMGALIPCTRVLIICARNVVDARRMWDEYEDARTFIMINVTELGTANWAIKPGVLAREDA